MLQSAQHVAIDLTRNSLQTSDLSSNNVGSSEPDGVFAALLQVPPPDDGEPTPVPSGSELPVVGSELPAGDTTADTSLTEFIAFYEGDSDPSLPDATADQFDADAGADPAAAADITGLAVETGSGPRIGDAGREDSRTQLRTDSNAMISRRDHGRLPFAQPLTAPDRMIFKAAGPGGEMASGNDLAAAVTGREQMLADAANASLERPDPGVRMRGQPFIEQGARAPGDPLATFELPVQKDGVESVLKPATAVPTVAAAAHLTDPTQVRDLAGVAKPTPVLAATIDQPVMDEAWGEAFQDRILWMAKGRIQNAEIRLNPAELGPIRVQVTVEDDAAMLQFTAQHNATREAIEQALPRLREMLSENGLTLAESSINDSGTDREGDQAHASQSGSAADADSAAADGADAEAASIRRIDSSSLVDTFV